MNIFDWLVLILTLLGITIYGIYKGSSKQNLEGYLLGSRQMPWYAVMFSVITTQASAITFLSAPGQAYTDGIRFVQFYLGMPLAMIVICIYFLPRYHTLNVYTAYQYLETRFNVQTRVFTAFLFLLLRGLSAGLTIYAPAIILSSVLGWNIILSNLLMGGLVILYTMSGGSKAVSYTQLQQMIVITLGMLLAGIMVVYHFPDDMSFSEGLFIAGKLDHMNAITTDFNPNDKYNIWSGIIGGFFLALSYFGTDQSQVSRYLSAKNIHQSRIGLLMTGFVKIPMQFLILLIGVLLLAFSQFKPAPITFNEAQLIQAKVKLNGTNRLDSLKIYEQQLNEIYYKKSSLAHALLAHKEDQNLIHQLKLINAEEKNLQSSGKKIIQAALPDQDANDTNYIFINFVMHYLPHGIIGLLIAMIFCASWSSTASELNALASTVIIDIYRRLFNKDETDAHYLGASKIATLLWGLFAIAVAMFASAAGSLIEAVNIMGSLFYGTILGVFLTGFFLKKVKGRSVLLAAIVSELMVITAFIFNLTAFLWLNLLGCVMVMLLALLFQIFDKQKTTES